MSRMVPQVIVMDCILKILCFFATFHKDAVLDEHAHLNALHECFVAMRQDRFVGRTKLLNQTMKKLEDTTRGMVALVGKSGSGKTGLMSALIQRYVGTNQCSSGLHLLTHFLGAAPGSTNIVAMLRRLCQEMKRRFALKTAIPEEYK